MAVIDRSSFVAPAYGRTSRCRSTCSLTCPLPCRSVSARPTPLANPRAAFHWSLPTQNAIISIAPPEWKKASDRRSGSSRLGNPAPFVLPQRTMVEVLTAVDQCRMEMGSSIVQVNAECPLSTLDRQSPRQPRTSLPKGRPAARALAHWPSASRFLLYGHEQAGAKRARCRPTSAAVGEHTTPRSLRGLGSRTCFYPLTT